ncbi:hypothetical protein CL656_05040 [bacterium]|nr:hypothetical protein [bacterium]|tara:strand:- start:1734 stop:3431 length:1698 start_codon:yes stop_codon:yes gene_type:complete
MVTNQDFPLANGKDNPLIEDEIDLKQLFSSLYRNKKLIGKFSLFGLILSSLIAFSSKEVWKGDFQIVIDSSSRNKTFGFGQSIAKFIGSETQGLGLETEVGILESPSVLLNIFEFVKAQKELKNKSSTQKLRFTNWKNGSLDIELEKNTSILNISYIDTDKELILPVLKKISSKYQEYSGKNKLRDIELAMNFYKNQIDIYTNKSFNSLKEAQQYAISQDLSLLDGDADIDTEIPNSINIEKIRIEAANKIRAIDQQLLQIKELTVNPDQIMYVASTIPSLTELSNKLKTIDSDLSRFRLTFQEDDEKIQNLIEERVFRIDLLKRQVKGFLIAKRNDAQARLKAAERPEGVLIKYRQLLGDAKKDKSTLNKLKDEYRLVLLEKARSQDPWELITTPTLLPDPIAPRKKRYLALGLLGGALLGSSAALIYEKRKDIIFSTNEIESLVKYPLLAELSVNQKSWIEPLGLLISGPLSDTDGNIALIPIGEIPESALIKLNQNLEQFIKNRQIKLTKDITEATKYANLIIVTALGVTKRREVLETSKKLLWQKKPVIGVLALNQINSKT